MLTTRKGNKRFAFYDLKLTLAWEASQLAPAGTAACTAAGTAEAATAVDDTPAGGEAAGEAGADCAAGEGATDVAAEAAAPSPAVSGEITIAEFGSGSDHDDIEVAVTVSGGWVRSGCVLAATVFLGRRAAWQGHGATCCHWSSLIAWGFVLLHWALFGAHRSLLTG